MKTPALPLGLRCRHSNSRTKFSYWRSVRRAPVGMPSQWIMPSRTVNVSGAQLTLTHPRKSRPLKIGLKLGAAPATGSTVKRIDAKIGVAVGHQRRKAGNMVERCRHGLPLESLEAIASEGSIPTAPNSSQQPPHAQRPFHCWFLTFNRSGEGLPSGSKVMLVSEPHATSLKSTNNVRGTISTT